MRYSKFQFTHPGGVRLLYGVGAFAARQVSIHAPGRGATGAVLSSAPSGCSFNSRTREGCDVAHPIWVEETSVSIHAPGRGATLERLYPALVLLFQFTHPGGVRRPLGVAEQYVLIVSIHAPGRGATWGAINLEVQNFVSFNSRTREGCDGHLRSQTYLTKSFNSRTREGCDPL